MNKSFWDGLSDQQRDKLIELGFKEPIENKTPRDIWTHRENILLTFDLKAEPNETVLTAIKIDGNQMEFKSFSGFTALDIYNLLFGKDNE